MGIPTRFSIEYPERCLELVHKLDDYAREHHLVGSFALLAAASVLTIPFERADTKHVLHRGKDNPLSNAIHSLKRVKFAAAPFWAGAAPAEWRQGRIAANLNDPAGWIGTDGKHPFVPGAENVIGKKAASEVLRPLRNALAHGNIVYLNKDGVEREGDDLHYLAFLSRYEADAQEAPATKETYRIISTTQEEFLRFVKLWAYWIANLAREDPSLEAA